MTLRLILGDQLNLKHSWFEKQDENTIYVLYELHQEADYVVHHIQKLVAFFSAMRAFASDFKIKDIKYSILISIAMPQKNH